MEASALRHASRHGFLARRSPLLKLQGDDKLIALVRDGNSGAFDAIVERYQPRLLGFCRQMLGSTEDAEDVLQEVFVNAYRAICADERTINLRPWLYRIARNRCLNHLRKPTADGQDTMDTLPVVEAASTHERVHNREEFRQLMGDVNRLPETQRSALLLREMDAMSYDDIAQSMDTTVPSVKSLLVRARISLAEASQARRLTCGEVRLELAEAAEGLCRASGPVRRHVRDCEGCAEFRDQVRSDAKVLAGLAPVGPLLALKAFISSKLGFGSGAGVAGTGGTSAGAAGTFGGAGSIGAGAGTLGAGAASSAAGGLGLVGGAIGVKAVAGVVTAAVITAGAVEVKQQVSGESVTGPARVVPHIVQSSVGAQGPALAEAPQSNAVLKPQQPPEAPPAAPTSTPPPAPAPAPVATDTPGDPTAPPDAAADPTSPPSSSTSVLEPSADASPYPAGDSAVTTVSDPETQPSSPPPGFSDPPSSSSGDSAYPSGDPPTATSLPDSSILTD